MQQKMLITQSLGLATTIENNNVIRIENDESTAI